jgi:pyridoxamine 5'-phosphate oxidase family protein
MSFKPHEIEFMKTAELARLATVQPDGTLQNSPVGFTYNEDLGTIDVHGYRMSRSRKFRNLASNRTVAVVIDDIASRNPWRVRCLEIRPNRTSWQRTPATCRHGKAIGAQRRSAASTPSEVLRSSDSDTVNSP